MAPPIKSHCFVLMPFEDKFDEVYTRGIVPAANAAGFKCSRADSALEPKSIIREIIQGIFTSDAIVADITDGNPNVFYELGVAHVIDNKALMIVRKPYSRLPFDLKSYRVIGYDHTFQGIDTELKNKLTKALGRIAVSRASPSNPVQDFRPVEYTVPLIDQAKLESRIRVLVNRVARLQKEERRRQIITLIASLRPNEMMHLKNLASEAPFRYTRRHTFLDELRHLRQLGLIRNKPNTTIGKIPKTGNLKDFLEVTEEVIVDFFRLINI